MGEQEIQLEQENIIVYSGGGAVNSVNGYTGDVVLTTSDLENTSDYQTGDEVDASIAAAIADKQDVLTAGTNINISNENVISATDTTYSAGSGLNLTGTQFSVDTNTIATKQSVTDEAGARSAADINLQGQIDAISASSDVTDIVGTYAALQAYDTSKLNDNDIIKVLQDEHENDETTYYRWSTTTETFTLIGEEGPYYTKAATDTLLAGKQDTLTAGSNITIEEESGTGDLVISATDTTYSAFTGTDGTAAGTSGLVPAPATTDAGKYLKADGTWGTVSAGPTVVQTTGTSTTDVMSQNATTSMVFTDPATQYKIKIGTGGSTWGDNIVQIGRNTNTLGHAAVAIGLSANASAQGSIALGAYSNTTTTGTMHIGSSNTSYGYNSSNYRLLTGLYDPQNAHDAANKEYVDGKVLTAAGAPTTSTVGTVGQLYEDSTNGDLYICTDATDPYVWEEVGAGGGGVTVVQTPGTSQSDVMSQNATTSMVFADPATQYKIKIGAGTSTSVGSNAIEIGRNAKAPSSGGVAIGYNSEADFGSISVGNGATTKNQYSTAIGASSEAGTIPSAGGKTFATALGVNAKALGCASVAIGSQAYADTDGQFDIGCHTGTSGYNSSAYRLLTGLYDPQSAHDAANKEYVDGKVLTAAGAPTTATVGTVGQLYEDSTNGDLYICTDATNPYVWEEVGAGGGGVTVVQTPGTSQTDVMSQNATTSMVFADPATQYKIKIGAGTSASEGNDGIEIGHNAAATQVNALAIGVSAEATGARSTAVGEACRVRSHDSVGLGGATIGSSSNRSVAIGSTSEVSSNALASIALGAYSKATQQGQMDISTLATTNTNGYNNSQYRLLTGLYDPQSAHDAANKEYVDSAIIQSGTAAPTTSTAAAVGALMATVESGTGHLYICTDDTGGTYTWQALV